MALSKPILVVFFIQALYTGMFLLSKAAFNVGMNNFIFTFYRQAIATIFLGPVALFLERKNIPPLSFKKFWQIFAMSLFGITLSLDLYGIGLTYTSATMGAATTNCLPVITFFLAVLVRKMDLEEDLIEHHQIILIGLVVCTIFWIGKWDMAIHRRLEVWKIKTAPGIAKLIGVVICLGGAMTLALYKGPSIKLFSHPHLLAGHPAANQPPQTQTHSGPTWIKGVFILLTGNTFWALWLVMQARIMKGYPSKLLFTALSCFLSSIQSFAIAILVERRPSQWMLGWNVRLLAVAYCGIVVTGVAYYLQAYVIEKKGPVFLALWTPLGLILTMLCSVLLLGEIITLGSVIGGILLVGGLYSFLWAKSKEQMIIPSTCSTVVEADKEGLEFKVIEGTKNSPSIV